MQSAEEIFAEKVNNFRYYVIDIFGKDLTTEQKKKAENEMISILTVIVKQIIVDVKHKGDKKLLEEIENHPRSPDFNDDQYQAVIDMFIKINEDKISNLKISVEKNRDKLKEKDIESIDAVAAHIQLLVDALRTKRNEAEKNQKIKLLRYFQFFLQCIQIESIPISKENILKLEE